MAPKLAATATAGTKRAAASWVKRGSSAQSQALHSLDSLDDLDFTESSPVSPKAKKNEDFPFFTRNVGTPRNEEKTEPLPFVRKLVGTPRKVSGREGKRRENPRLLPVDSTRITDDKFTKLWADKVKRKSPLIIRHMPGFLESQTWFQHPESNPAGEFTSRTTPVEKKPKENRTSFAILRDSIMADALRSGNTYSRSAMGQLFDSLGVKFKIKRTMIAADDASDEPSSQVRLEKFLHWLVKSGRSTSHNLDGTVERLLRSAKDSSLIWEPFDAPLAFIREVLQYNHELEVAGRWDEVVTRLGGLIELEDRLTEDFPYPPKVREVGGLTYGASSCSIRFGIRPIRSDLRRSTDVTVLGQLAGYSRVLLVPPKLKSLGNQALEYHPYVRELRKDHIVRLSERPVKALEKKTWTREFEETIPERLDATIKPGEVLLIPNGWWYGVRSINYHNELHATVGWYLQTDRSPRKLWLERQARDDNNAFRAVRFREY
ncbi:hypothetical protein PG988_003180 [Apiospora saccharicola]